jgi:hypothetical protein
VTSAPRAALGVGPAFLYAPGGLGPSGQVWLAFDWMPTERFGAGAFALIPVAPASVRDAAGAADVWTFLCGLGVRAELAHAAGFSPSLGAGVAFGGLRAESTASRSPLALGISRSAYAGGPHLGAGLGYSLAPYARIGVDLVGGLLVPRFEVDLASKQVASWGAPFVAGSLSVSVGSVSRGAGVP